jgi:hypothetical protein
MFSRLWKSSILARANPAVPVDFIYLLEDFCACAQSKNIRQTGGLRASDAGIDAGVPV